MNTIAITTAAVTGGVNPPVMPPVPDDLELSEEVKKKHHTRKVA